MRMKIELDGVHWDEVTLSNGADASNVEIRINGAPGVELDRAKLRAALDALDLVAGKA